MASSSSSSPKAESPPSEADPYEFSDAHKDSFRALAASVSFVGVCLMMFAVLSAVFALGELYMGFVPNGLATAVIAGVYAATAWWLVSAGRSLSAMVRTRGQDVERLMEAVTQLRRYFGLARVLIILLAMSVSVGGAVMVWCTVIAEKGGKCLSIFG